VSRSAVLRFGHNRDVTMASRISAIARPCGLGRVSHYELELKGTVNISHDVSENQKTIAHYYMMRLGGPPEEIV
jgi:hypothetical protein